MAENTVGDCLEVGIRLAKLEGMYTTCDLLHDNVSTYMSEKATDTLDYLTFLKILNKTLAEVKEKV